MFALMVTMLLASRNSLLTFLLGLSHERALAWHGFMAVVATLLSLYHANTAYLDIDGEGLLNHTHVKSWL